jgi:antitoxin (DNA-binding transcriptional repressor) of toxin-antitoxin stability system
MVHTISIQQAAGELVALVRGLHPGDEIVLTDGPQPVARIVPEPLRAGGRTPGLSKGMLEIVSDDEADIREHFRDYMP